MRTPTIAGLVTLLAAGGVPLAALLALGMIILGSDHTDDAVCSPSTINAGVTADGWTIPIAEDYRITSRYGPRIHPIRGTRELHTGIDLASNDHYAPVLAASTGTVTRITDLGGRSYGLWVELDHGGGLTTRYAHLASTKVRIGQHVTTGQQIAVEGASGGVTGPHLHFEIRINGRPVNPADDLPARAGLSFDGNPGTPSGAGTVAVSADLIGSIIPNPAGVDRSANLTAQQRATAAAIVEEGQKLGLGPRAWAIALITALQESDLGADPTSHMPNSDGDVGVFQQRAYPGWYADQTTTTANTAVLNDVRYAARTFYLGHDVAVRAPGGNPLGYHIPGLVDIRGWDQMPLWLAAQKVQVSAYPLYYAKHEATVATLLTTLNVEAVTYNCPTGVPANGSIGEQVVAHALTQLGVPYSWGGGDETGPTTGTCCSPAGQDGRTITGFDCSGLVLWAWSKVGVTLPHQSATQKAKVQPIPVDQIRAGDLLFFPGHVGLADGKGGMIEAARPGKPVRVTPDVLNDSYYGPRFTGAGRPTLPNAN